MSFKYYDPERLVAGKKMKDHFRFAIAYWHSFCGTGNDPFGPGTKVYPWDQDKDPIQRAKDKMDAAFEFITKIGAPFYCFHDFDLVDEGASLAESQKRLQTIVDYARLKQKDTGVKLSHGFIVNDENELPRYLGPFFFLASLAYRVEPGGDFEVIFAGKMFRLSGL